MDDCGCPGPNYGHLHKDPESGVQYLTEVGTGLKLFRVPPCRICEIARYSLSPFPPDICPSCSPANVEANENEPELFGAAE